MNKNILLLGGGGHCLTVIDALECSDFNNAAIIDEPHKVGQSLAGVQIIGSDADLPHLREDYDSAFIAIAGIGIWRKREQLFSLTEFHGFEMPGIVHSRAIVSKHCHIGRGVLVAAGTIVNGRAAIEDGVILNTGCLIEHECRIQCFAHISPGAILCGGVTIGEGTHIGAGSVVRQGVHIGSNVIIGIGSVVTKDIPDNMIAYGNPCRIEAQRESI